MKRPSWHYIGAFELLTDIFAIISAGAAVHPSQHLKDYRIEERRRGGRVSYHFFVHI
jgi:hypothetical protein